MLKRLADGPRTTRIAEPRRRTVLRWHGDDDARRAVYANRARLFSGVARAALLLRAVLCERAFAHVLDRGGMRRTWLRGRNNLAKRYLIHVAGHNLGLLMRALFGAGTPRAGRGRDPAVLVDRRRSGRTRAAGVADEQIDHRWLWPHQRSPSSP